ncbi:hypothetical protein ACLMJK_002473 [Lecanora helva]
MPLPSALSRGFSFVKPKEPKPQPSKPAISRSKTTGSALQRSFHKSTFLNGRQPPKTKTILTPDQVLDLTFMLSHPVDTPLLTSSIANLEAPLTRSSKLTPASCLCDVHTWMDLRWIEALTAVIGEEIGPRLKNLRNAPSQLRSVETEEILGMLDNYAHIFPCEDTDGSRMANPYQCNIRNCLICNITTCKACKLSQFFQNEAAVKALNVCVKGRKKRNRPWPEACAWLDPNPGRGWEMKWKKEGLPILSDRIIIRQWMMAGGKERLTSAMTSLQAQVMANKEAVEKRLDRVTKMSMRNEGKAEYSAYDEILDRKWTVCEDALESTETIDLLRKMGMDDEERVEQGHEGRADSYAATYHSLVGSNSQESMRNSSSYLQPHDQKIQANGKSTVSRSSSARSGTDLLNRRSQVLKEFPYYGPEPEEQGSRNRTSGGTHLSRVSTVTSRQSLASDTTLISRSSQSSPSISIVEALKERDGEAWAASYSYLLGLMPEKRSTIPSRARAQTSTSVNSWAIFNRSPLAQARQSCKVDPIDECESRAETPRRSHGRASHMAAQDCYQI